MLVVLLFFRDLRNTLVTVAGLPIIMIATFAALKFFGLTINLISLLALSVSVGLVIDDAIVVRENIFRQMERGLTPRLASSRGTAQVSLSVLAMSLTIIAVFLPVTFSGGITGIIFSSFGVTVASAMAISLVEAFTLAPMLSAYFFKQKQVDRPAVVSENAEHADEEHEELLDEANEDPGRLGRIYQRLLEWSLRHRLVVVGITVGVLVLSVVVASGLKFSFFPTQDTGEFAIGFSPPPGTALAQTDQQARRAEEIIIADPDIEAVLSNVNAENASFAIRLVDGASTEEVQNRLRPQLQFLPTLVLARQTVQGTSTDISGRDIQLSVQSTRSPAELLPVLQQLQTDAAAVEGLTDIDSTFKPGKAELQIRIDPARAGDLGYTNQDIASSVRAMVSGERATTFREGGQDTDVYVRLQEGDRTSVEQIQQISIPTASGSVPLASLAEVELTAGPTTIRRYDRLNEVLIGANVVGRNVTEVQAEIQAGIDRYAIPSDIQITFAGFAQTQNEGFTTLLIAMGLSVLFVYMVLASQFGSFTQPFVIMMAMPFSFIGAFLALRIRGLDLDIVGMIGLIMLLGLVVKNSILMVDFANRLRVAGMEKHKALEVSGAVRLRPILMTTIALVAGSIPSAIGLGQGAEIRRSLSTVVIGGLITSVMLTLLVIPTAYSLLDSALVRLGRLFGRRGPDDTDQPSTASGGARGWRRWFRQRPKAAPSTPIARAARLDDDGRESRPATGQNPAAGTD
jgi:hydrophobic/amphiphilic exporter-1 (mainly G- bacteria), HAE1 family